VTLGSFDDLISQNYFFFFFATFFFATFFFFAILVHPLSEIGLNDIILLHPYEDVLVKFYHKYIYLTSLSTNVAEFLYYFPIFEHIYP